MSEIPHIPVLYREVVDAFDGIKEGIIVDCTMGYGGHSSMLLEANEKITLIGIDQDQTAIDFSSKRLAPFGDRARIKKGRFSDVIKTIIAEEGSENIRGILADIGVSSLQLDQKERGFSYESETLDMRMDSGAALSAAEVVNGYSQKELERILRDYGEIRNAAQIASAIIKHRPFYSAKELSDVVKPYGPRGKKIHPATLVMQAIRIEVNDELGELSRLLDAIEEADLPHARIGIISFHSLEDRRVKRAMRAWADPCTCPPSFPLCTCGRQATVRLLTRKVMQPSDAEVRNNPMARSTRLRAVEKL